MVGERGSPGCDVMATLPRVATPQKAFVLHADSQVWEADAEWKQVCISDSHTHTHTYKLSGEGTGNTRLEAEDIWEGSQMWP